MKLSPTIAISLCLNLALAGAVIHRLKQPVSPTPLDSAARSSETTSSPAHSSAPAAGNSPAPVTFVTNHFGWRAVEAEDYEQFAMNLRAIGCPEKTIRDIVGARARRELDQLSRNAAPACSFWTAGLQRAHARRDAERTLAASRAKLLASVERALGREVDIEDGKLMEDFVEQAIVRFVSGPMSEEKFSRLAGLLVRQEAQVSEVRARTHGVLLAEDEEELKNLGRQFHEELAALLLPAEREELTARPAAMKLADKVQFEATALSPAEIRGVALIRAQFDAPATGGWFEDESLTDEEETQAAQAVREFLGEARYAQFERAGDRDYQALYEVGRDRNLPREAAVKAFEIRQITAQEAARLRADKSLSDAELQHQFVELQTRAQQGVLQVLGADACAQYLNRSGTWLTNLNGL